MSVWVMGHVWKSGRYEQGTLLVLLALADYAHDDGTHIFPTIRKLASKARLSERQTQRALKDLRDDGIIELIARPDNSPRRNSNEYRINMRLLLGWVADTVAHEDDTTKRHPSVPESEVETTTETSPGNSKETESGIMRRDAHVTHAVVAHDTRQNVTPQDLGTPRPASTVTPIPPDTYVTGDVDVTHDMGVTGG